MFVYLNGNAPSGWSSATSVAPTAVLRAVGGQTGDQLGFSTSVSQDGSTIIAGAPSAPNGSCCTPGPGEIYVFRATPQTWSGFQGQTQHFAALTGQGVTPLSQFGTSVAVAGDGSTVGAGGNATVGTATEQVVYLFE